MGIGPLVISPCQWLPLFLTARTLSGLEAFFPSAKSKSMGIRPYIPWHKEISKLQLCLLGLCPGDRACPSTHHQVLSTAVIYPCLFFLPATGKLFFVWGWGLERSSLSHGDFVYSWSLLYLQKGTHFGCQSKKASLYISYISTTPLPLGHRQGKSQCLEWRRGWRERVEGRVVNCIGKGILLNFSKQNVFHHT